MRSVFAKTDMTHQAQEGTPISDILLGLAVALVRNYASTLIKGVRQRLWCLFRVV
jgi:activator of 2-hydroxyglutaryl-CoA dehydratase